MGVKEAIPWYRTYNEEITPVWISRFTDSSVWVYGSRWGGSNEIRLQRRITDYECYFPSFDAAIAHVRKRLERKRESANWRMESCKREVETTTARLAALDKEAAPPHPQLDDPARSKHDK